MTLETLSDITELGRALGHDLHRFGRPDDSAHWPASVAEGFAQASARSRRTERSDRFVRKWLQLRLGALRRGRAVADDVTPRLLREIDVACCPVTRVTLTHGELLDSDWSVDRLNNDGAYAMNNLAVMSTHANTAKGGRCYAHVHALSERQQCTEGLAPAEWLRLATLMLGPCFAEQPRLAPTIPLAAPLPARTARPGVQLVQHVLTTQARPAAGKNALIKHFGPACADERSRIRLRLLVEAVHEGLKPLDFAHDVWLQPGVMDGLHRWREALPEPAWALAGEIARRLTGSSRVPLARLQSWRLAERGYLAERSYLASHA